MVAAASSVILSHLLMSLSYEAPRCARLLRALPVHPQARAAKERGVVVTLTPDAFAKLLRAIIDLRRPRDRQTATRLSV